MKKGSCGMIGGAIGFVAGNITNVLLMYKGIKRKDMRINKYKDDFQLLNLWMTVREKEGDLGRFWRENEIQQPAIYGMGAIGSHLKTELEQSGMQVAYLIDKNTNLNISGCRIFSPQDELPESDAVIVTVTAAYEEIKEALCGKVHCPVLSLWEILHTYE